MADGQHFYDRNGKACFSVPNKSSGGMRPVTIRDARANRWLPSVTTVLAVLDRPTLSDWKHRQITEWCWNNRTEWYDNQENWHTGAIVGAFKQVDDAADLGTNIHKALEQHFKGGVYDLELTPYVQAVEAWMQKEGVELLEQELRLVSVSHGFAGTTDAVIRCPRGTGILDFKSRKTTAGKPCTPWETQPMQIAAYHIAKFGMMPEAGHVGCNVFISTTEPGRVEACWYDHERLQKEWQAFSAALSLWRHIRGYDPRDVSQAPEALSA